MFAAGSRLELNASTRAPPFPRDMLLEGRAHTPVEQGLVEVLRGQIALARLAEVNVGKSTARR